MRCGLAILMLMATGNAALAHGYRVGDLEITHPAVMVPSEKSDCSCAHVRITNHGTTTEYFLGASIAAASRTHLIEISTTGDGLRVSDARCHSARCYARSLASPVVPVHERHYHASGGRYGCRPRTLFERRGAVDIRFMIDSSGH